MKTNPALELTEPQARRLSITLADLERELPQLERGVMTILRQLAAAGKRGEAR